MTIPNNHDHAQARLEALLFEMENLGSRPRRTAKLIREAVDVMLLDTGKQPERLPVLIGIDPPPVTQDLATHLVIHHLGLAAAYYEAAAPNLDLALARARGAGEGCPAPSLRADRAWIRELGRSYREMEQEEESDHD